MLVRKYHQELGEKSSGRVGTNWPMRIAQAVALKGYLATDTPIPFTQIRVRVRNMEGLDESKEFNTKS